MNAWILVALGINAAVVLMTFVWLAARWLNNAGIVDVAWSYGFAVVAILYALLGPGDPVRKMVITAMVLIWSVRLGTHLVIRVAREHPQEDARYAKLREQFPKRPWLMFFGFFQLQAVLLGILTMPFAIASANRAPGLNAWEWAGVLLWLLALVGETVADGQLKAFRHRPENKGQVCQAGLWKYSRHPNYFCEWLIWIAYFLFATGSPWGWLSVSCPLLMYHFLTKVTGVPPAEEQSLQSRGEAYRRYQETTNAFFPGKPRPSGAGRA